MYPKIAAASMIVLVSGFCGCAIHDDGVAKGHAEVAVEPPGAVMSPDGTSMYVPTSPTPNQLTGLNAIVARQTVTSFRIGRSGQVESVTIPGPVVWPVGSFTVSRAEISADGMVMSMSAPNLRPGDCCNLKVDFHPEGGQTLTCSGTCSSGPCHIITYEGSGGGTTYECVCN